MELWFWNDLWRLGQVGRSDQEALSAKEGRVRERLRTTRICYRHDLR
jgi:hypothetical protein